MNSEQRIVNNNADSNSLCFVAFTYAVQECDATKHNSSSTDWLKEKPEF